MKRILVCFMAILMVFALCACDNGNTTTDTTDTTDATTTAVKVEETTAPADDKVTYTITVVDEENNPVVGAMVQLCLEACIPGLTNLEGVATFNVAEEDYKVSFVTIPEGYSCENNEFYFADGSYEMTITLAAN